MSVTYEFFESMLGMMQVLVTEFRNRDVISKCIIINDVQRSIDILNMWGRIKNPPYESEYVDILLQFIKKAHEYQGKMKHWENLALQWEKHPTPELEQELFEGLPPFRKLSKTMMEQTMLTMVGAREIYTGLY